MEKRAEAVRKQANAIAELESELSKAKEQGKDHETAIEQLQGDLDALERENTKLKQAAPSEKSGEARYSSHTRRLKDLQAGNATEGGQHVVYNGSLETVHLVEQVARFEAGSNPMLTNLHRSPP